MTSMLTSTDFVSETASLVGRSPTVAARAPGRINLIGEHIDYCGGTVMPIAIPHACYTAITQGHSDRTLTLTTTLNDATVEADPTRPIKLSRDIPQGHWASYILGVVAGFQRMTNTDALVGAHIHVHSDVPLGAGLSSSAALEVSVATALAALLDHPIEGIELAKLCQRAEHEFAGVPCGLMDQAASTLCRADHALLLDCATERTTHAPVGDAARLVVVHSGVSHALADGAYAKRRAATESAAARIGVEHLAHAPLDAVATLPAKERPFARHVITEQFRVTQARQALNAGDMRKFGSLMSASHDSLRDDYLVSCDEIDALVDAMRAVDGCLGARMTGGGFGGCVIALVEDGAELAVRAAADTRRDICPNLRHIDAAASDGASRIA